MKRLKDFDYGLLAIALLALLALGTISTTEYVSNPQGLANTIILKRIPIGSSWAVHQGNFGENYFASFAERKYALGKESVKIRQSLELNSDNGYIKYTRDERDRTGTYLHFSNDKPIMTWNIEFFPNVALEDLEDERISLWNQEAVLLRHKTVGNTMTTYFVIGANTISCTDNTDDTIFGKGVKINDDYADMNCRILATNGEMYGLAFQWFPDPDVGKDLYIEEKECSIKNLLGGAICFGELEGGAEQRARVDIKDSIVELKATGNKIRIQLVDYRGKRYGSSNKIDVSEIITKEGDVIKIGDYAVVTGSDKINAPSRIVRLEKGDMLVDAADGNKFYIKNNNVNIDGYNHEVVVNPDGSIILATLDGAIDGERAHFNGFGGIQITIKSGSLEIDVPKQLYKESGGPESVKVTFSGGDINEPSGVKLYSGENTPMDVGRLVYGLGVIYDDDDREFFAVTTGSPIPRATTSSSQRLAYAVVTLERNKLG